MLAVYSQGQYTLGAANRQCDAISISNSSSTDHFWGLEVTNHLMPVSTLFSVYEYPHAEEYVCFCSVIPFFSLSNVVGIFATSGFQNRAPSHMYSVLCAWQCQVDIHSHRERPCGTHSIAHSIEKFGQWLGGSLDCFDSGNLHTLSLT